jgi:hypothetical protein
MVDTAPDSRLRALPNKVSSGPSHKQARNCREGTYGCWRPEKQRRNIRRSAGYSLDDLDTYPSSIFTPGSSALASRALADTRAGTK